MFLRLLPLATGLLPVVAIHASYAIAIAAERVPRCFPYFDGCTSISATGRYPPASYLFKAAMLPEAVLLFVFWLCAVAWLRALDALAHKTIRRSNHVATMGAVGALALIVYVTFLGTQAPFYEFMRRFGIYLFFLFTILAQLSMALRAMRLATVIGDRVLVRLVRGLLLMAVLPFLLGVLNLLLKSLLADADQEENVIEWIVVMLMQIFFVISYFAWRRTGFSARFGVSHGGSNEKPA